MKQSPRSLRAGLTSLFADLATPAQFAGAVHPSFSAAADKIAGSVFD